MIRTLFPGLDFVWGNVHQPAGNWKKERRICSPDVFPIYFKLSLAPGAVSKMDIDALLNVAQSSNEFAQVLVDAANSPRHDGLSKASALLDRLLDYVDRDMDVETVRPVIAALFEVGDDLPKDEVGGMHLTGNDMRISRLVYRLLEKVDPKNRAGMLKYEVSKAKALHTSLHLVQLLQDEAEEAPRKGEESLLTRPQAKALMKRWIHRLKHFTGDEKFINHTEIARFLYAWRQWGDPQEVDVWWQSHDTDETLLNLIAGYVSNLRETGATGAWNDRKYVDPLRLAHYGDVQNMANRVKKMLDLGAINDADKLLAAELFTSACEQLKAGKKINKFGVFEGW